MPDRPTTSNPRRSAPGRPGLAVLRMRVGGAFRVARSATTLPSCCPLRRSRTASISRRRLHAAFGVGLEHDLRAGIGAGDALQVDRPSAAATGSPCRDSFVTSGSGWLTDTSFSPSILLLSLQADPAPLEGVGLTAHRLSGSGTVRRCPNVQMPPSRALELHERVHWTAADGRGVDRLERRRQRRQRSGSERARLSERGRLPAVVVGGVGVRIGS